MRQHPHRALFAGIFLLAAGASLAGGCGATINVVQCDDGQEFCGDTCVDLDTNPKHCGTCFARCVDGCSDGVCEGGGPGGGGPGTGGSAGEGGGGECAPLAACDGVCTNTDVDPSNCGDCGVVCPAGLCVLGDCVTGCTGNLVDCGTGTCVDVSLDEQNCGGCFIGCGPGQQCQDFSCVGGDCGLACGLCSIEGLDSATSLFIQGDTSGGGDAFTSSCAGGGSAPEIAHSFVAPVTGTYFVDTFGSSFDTVLSVLAGCTEIACNDDTSGTDSQVVVDLLAGQEVFFVVDGYGEGSQGFYNLALFTEDVPGCPPGLTLCGEACVDPFFDAQHCGGCFSPCDDDEACIEGSCECAKPDCNACDSPTCGSCSSVTSLPSAVPLTRSGSTVGEDSGIESSCGSSPAPESLYRFVAPFDANFRFDTFGSSFDTLLALRSPGCAELACNDDFEGLASQVELPLAAGQEVLVVVDGFSGDSGSYELHVEADLPLCAPVLDGALPIVVADTTAGQPNTFQTSCVGGASPDRTYHFFAPFSGVFSFDTEGSEYDTTLEILSGTCGGPSLDCNDDFTGVTSRIELFLEQDQLVTVVVDGFKGASGDFVLRIE